MTLPASFEEKLHAFFQDNGYGLDTLALRKAYEEISQTFRQEQGKARWNTWGLTHHIAYVLGRMPATYAVCTAVFSEACRRLSTMPVTLLDVGAGSGAASWAAQQLMPTLNHFTAIENNPHFVRLLQTLAPEGVSWSVQSEKFLKASLVPHDWVVLSYVLCEQSEDVCEDFIAKAWDLTTSALLVIQPGTPQGYRQLMQARAQVIASGGQIIAPCPHQKACPLVENDWCHFSVRLARCRVHHYLKHAVRGFEDEKYAYFVAVKRQIDYSATQQRVIRHPLYRKGHVVLTLCTDVGVHQKIISARHKSLYMQMRDTEWGDDIETNE